MLKAATPLPVLVITLSINNNQGWKIPSAFLSVFSITNRKVEAIETITTAAGTFDCVKISYDVESKMMFTIKAKGAEWYALETGLVKSESYDAKGKLTGSQELVKLKR